MGQVYFVGAGPGAADLITLRGAERLGRADVVLFDALVDPALRAWAPHAVWIHVGKRGFGHATTRQNLQFHFIQMANVEALQHRLACPRLRAAGILPVFVLQCNP